MRIYVRGLNSCIQRKSDVARYRRYLKANGHTLVASPEESDLILLWTCAFRDDHRVNSLNKIKAYKRYDAELVVCGCLPSIDEEGLRDAFQGHFFAWKDDAERLPEILGAGAGGLADCGRVAGERDIGTDLLTFRKENPAYKVAYGDQFLKLFVSEGCSLECAYCVERLAFPPYRSIPIDELVSETRNLMLKTGSSKVVLWADSLGEYGRDRGDSLLDLIRELLRIDGLRIGLENLNPQHAVEFFDPLMDLVRSGDIFLLNMPIQSASDRLLGLMARKYSRAELNTIFGTLKAACFTEVETHVIVGFPTETEDEYEDTVDFLLSYSPKYVTLSGYMEARAAVSAGILPKVESSEIRKRVLDAARICQEKGIVCNYDNSTLSRERFEKELVLLSDDG